MKTVILAAGKGSRLGNTEQPKPLTLLSDGKSILQHQIEALQNFCSREDIIVVVGYQKEFIMDKFNDLLFVYNPEFERENTSKSLLRAVKKIKEDILWINGDVLFHSSILEKILAAKRNTLVVTEGTVGLEEVKYTSNAQGRIEAVSKNLQNGQGEAVGINFFTARSLLPLQKHLEGCQPNDYFEKAIEKCIDDGMDVWSCPVDKKLCMEIDFPEDLKHANLLLKDWTT